MMETTMHLWATDSIHNNKPIVILENIRSCYNVGNIIRTADALGWSVYIAWYTPSPHTQPKVKKTSLGAEESVLVRDFASTNDAISVCRENGYVVVAAEVTENALVLGDMDALKNLQNRVLTKSGRWISEEKNMQSVVDSMDKDCAAGENTTTTPQRAVVLWNEVVWVEPEILASVDAVVKIPMCGEKESLNVWQTAAIFMWELGK